MRHDGIALHTANASDRIALRGVRLRGRLTGMSLRVTLEQTFVNLEPRAIEAVYTFPLPEGAAVCGFEVVTADRVLTGQVEESDQAIERYEEAVDAGHGAFMVEQERPDVFTVRVGNLKPRQAATIRITYISPLERVDRQIRVAFPTTIAPRYATATATDPVEAMIDADALNPPHVLAVPYGLSMHLEIDLGRKITGVCSHSHPIHVDRDGDERAVVTLAGGVAEMNRDIVLTIALPKEHEPSVQWAKGEAGGSYLAVTFVPEFDESELGDPKPMETVFVLDCSGSMQGDSIQQAVMALELCLRSLSAGDTFNVCKFGSTFELMASEPVPYSQATLDRALKYVRTSLDLGGTELAPPLAAIFQTPPRAGQVRQVILLTDGQVTNEPACVQLARRHRGRNRIFTFGIGPACSAYLVKGLARATGGAAEFITAGERIDEKVLRTFGRLASPMVSDVSIDWADADVQTLAELPPVFDGDVLAVFGRTPGRVPPHVTLRCQTPGGEKHWTIPVPAAPVPESVTIATMWARRMIQSLEEVNADPGRARAAPAEQQRSRQTLINLSKEFGLLCSHTTYIAIEHRTLEERNEGRPALRRVPVALAEGWGGADDLMDVLMDAVPMAAPAAAPMARRRSLGERMKDALVGRKARTKKITYGDPGAPAYSAVDRRPGAPQVSPQTRGDVSERSLDLDLGDGSGLMDLTRECGDTSLGAVLDEIGPAAPGDSAEPRDVLPDLLKLQAANGSFGGGDRVIDLISAAGYKASDWLTEVNRSLPSLPAGVSHPDVVRTVLALLLLTRHHGDEKPLWQRAYRKTVRDFLAKALGWSVSEVEAWLESLAQQVAAR